MENSFETRINAEDPQEHERLLYEKLSEIQLYFAGQKFSQEVLTNPEIKFTQILDQYTTIISDLSNEYNQTEGANEDAWQEFLQPILVNIDQIHHDHQEDWHTQIFQLVLSKKNFLKELKKKDKPISNNQERSIGPIRHNISDNRETNLEEYGIKKSDECLEIHVEEFFKKAETELNPENLHIWFGKLAEEIIDKYPKVKFITGTSWLMDTPVAKRLGFQITDKAFTHHSQSTWLQFIDQNGQINHNRLKKLLETGDFLYKVRFGFMTVEDFLQKFLPADRRGQEIVLKEINKDWEEFHIALNKEGKQLKNDWSNLSMADLDNLETKFPKMVEFLKKVDIKTEFFSVLRKMKELNLSFPEGREKFKNEFDQFQIIVNKFVEETVYQDKKIVIV